FDAMHFSSDNPVDLTLIPWPILLHPHANNFREITWAKVEAFFAYAKAHLHAVGYLILVDSSRKRFHPDRWRAR
ncbi:hypothetical protein C8Q76DRAFT_596688, partial [Earliella scabrosa]